MARVRVPKRTYAFQFPSVQPLLCSALPCSALLASRSHQFAAMYKFHVRYIWFLCSCLAFSPTSNTYTARCSSPVLSLAPSLPSSSLGRLPLARHFRLSVSSIYLRSHILGAYVFATICLPSPSLLAERVSFRGICTVSHKRVGVAPQTTPLPPAAPHSQRYTNFSLPSAPLRVFCAAFAFSPSPTEFFSPFSFSCVCTFAGLFAGGVFFFLSSCFVPFCFAQGGISRGIYFVSFDLCFFSFFV